MKVNQPRLLETMRAQLHWPTIPNSIKEPSTSRLDGTGFVNWYRKGPSPSNRAAILIKPPTFLRRHYTGLNIFITPKAWDSLPLEGECWDSGGQASACETKHI